MNDDKTMYHYFALSFTHSEHGNTLLGSAYIGYTSKLITLPRLTEAKKSLGMSTDSVVTSVSYLGYMTHKTLQTLE